MMVCKYGVSVYISISMESVHREMYHLRTSNPYAAGGYFRQKRNDANMVKNYWNPGKWYSSNCTQQELSNEYQHDRV